MALEPLVRMKKVTVGNRGIIVCRKILGERDMVPFGGRKILEPILRGRPFGPCLFTKTGLIRNLERTLNLLLITFGVGNFVLPLIQRFINWRYTLPDVDKRHSAFMKWEKYVLQRRKRSKDRFPIPQKINARYLEQFP